MHALPAPHVLTSDGEEKVQLLAQTAPVAIPNVTHFVSTPAHGPDVAEHPLLSAHTPRVAEGDKATQVRWSWVMPSQPVKELPVITHSDPRPLSELMAPELAPLEALLDDPPAVPDEPLLDEPSDPSVPLGAQASRTAVAASTMTWTIFTVSPPSMASQSALSNP